MFLILMIGVLLIFILAFVLFAVRREESRLATDNMPCGKIEKYLGAERRRHVRFDSLLDIRYTMKKGNHTNDAKSRDISAGGLRLLVDKKLEQGTVLYIDVLRDNGLDPISLEGRVAWCNEAKDKTQGMDRRQFHVGIELTKIADDYKQMFTDLICSLEEGQKVKYVPDGLPINT